MPDNENLQTGIIRRVDDLGRVVIPKELRQQMGIQIGSAISVTYNGTSIVLTPYHIVNPLSTRVDEMGSVLSDFVDQLDPTDAQELRNHIEAMDSLLKSIRHKSPGTNI